MVTTSFPDALCKAIRSGDNTQVNKLLSLIDKRRECSDATNALNVNIPQNFIDINGINNAGKSPLYAAAQYGQTETAKSLIDRGANVDQADNDGCRPLFVAAQYGHREIANLLIDIGTNVNQADNDGCTPLYVTAQNGNTEIAKLLIDRGAIVNQTNNYGRTPLYIAALNGRTETAELLIVRGAKVNQADNDGWTPLYLATKNDYTKTAKLLIDRSAKINQADNNGCTPLYVAAQCDHTETAKLLIDNNANVHQADNNGCTPLYVAAQYDHTKTAELLIDNDANIHQADNNGCTPFYVAAQNGYTETAKLLIVRGANVNQANNYGWTPLYAATQEGYTSIIQPLNAKKSLNNAMSAFKENNQQLLKSKLKDAINLAPQMVIHYIKNVLDRRAPTPFDENQDNLLIPFITTLSEYMFSIRPKQPTRQYKQLNFIVGECILGSWGPEDFPQGLRGKLIEVLSYLTETKDIKGSEILIHRCYEQLITGKLACSTSLNDLKKKHPEKFKQAEFDVYKRKYSKLFPDNEHLPFISQLNKELSVQLFDPFRREYLHHDIEAMAEIADIMDKHQYIGWKLFWLAKATKEGHVESSERLNIFIRGKSELPNTYEKQKDWGARFKCLTKFYLRKANKTIDDEECQTYLRLTYEYALLAEKVFNIQILNALSSGVIRKSSRFFNQCVNKKNNPPSKFSGSKRIVNYNSFLTYLLAEKLLNNNVQASSKKVCK